MSHIMKFFNGLKIVVNYIKNHAFSAFVGFCLSVLNIGGMAYLFYYGCTLFGVVAALVLVLLVVPFAYDCVMCMLGKNPDESSK